MLGTCALANSTAFCRVNTLKWLMYTAQERGWIRLHPFIGFNCLPEYRRRSFLTEEDLQSIIHVKLKYKRQRAIRDMFLFMCFTGLGVCGSEGDHVQEYPYGFRWWYMADG